MTTVLLVIHLLITVALIGLIMIQRSEGGALGIGGGSMGSLMTARGSANFLTKTTTFLGIAFFVTSIALALIASNSSHNKSIVDQIQTSVPASPAPTETPAPAAPLPQ